MPHASASSNCDSAICPDTSDVGLVVNAGPRGERPGKLDAGHIDAGLVVSATGLLARSGGLTRPRDAGLVVSAKSLFR